MKKLSLLLVLLAAPAIYAQQPVNLSLVGGSSLALGQTSMSASLPVAIASNQSTLTVTGAGGTFPVTGTFWQATQPVSVASGQIASGAIASGAVASGAVASGAYASGSISDGADVTQGAKADAKSTATDTTAVTVMQVAKEISYMEQNPASRAVTNAGTFATQSVITAASGSIASGAIASGAIASGALASGSIASGACASGCIADGGLVTLGAEANAKSTATDTTAVTGISILKEISYMAQNPAALPADQSANVAQINGVTPLMGNGTTGTGSQRVTVASDNTPFQSIPVATATTTNTTLRCVLVSAASTNATNCKNAAGNVYGFRFVNTTATLYYLRMYNTSSSPTCSSATGFIESIPIPASATGAGIVSMEPFGEAYTTGISFCFTGGSSSTDNTNAATGVFGTILYF